MLSRTTGLIIARAHYSPWPFSRKDTPSQAATNDDADSLTRFDAYAAAVEDSESSQRPVERRGYDPPSDLEARLRSLVFEVVGPDAGSAAPWTATPLFDDAATSSSSDIRTPRRSNRRRYQLLTRCAREFGGHWVPNSRLHEMRSAGDVLKFYAEPVRPVTTFDAWRQQQAQEPLPRNLHVQWDPVRWLPDADPKFGGRTAFPGRSTVVSGLRARKAGIRGHEQPRINVLEREYGPIG